MTLFNNVKNSLYQNYQCIPSYQCLVKTSKAFATCLQERALFFARFFSNPRTVGAFSPSSEKLANEITKMIPSHPENPGPHYYLEVGAGTGVFTAKIIKILKDRFAKGDHLYAVELEKDFADVLRKKFAEYPNVHIICESIVDWKTDLIFDATVSGLPLNGFSPELAQKCIDKMKALTKPHGHISWFDYPSGVKYGKKYLGCRDKCRKKKEQTQLNNILKIKKRFYADYGIEKVRVKQRPSARVSHFKMSPKDEQKSTISAVSKSA